MLVASVSLLASGCFIVNWCLPVAMNDAIAKQQPEWKLVQIWLGCPSGVGSNVVLPVLERFNAVQPVREWCHTKRN
jgi:hypothetical protein